MEGRGPKSRGGHCKALPRALERKTKCGRKRSRSAPKLTTLRTYGPPKDKSRAERLWRMLRQSFPDVVDKVMEKEKEKEEEKEELRIPDKELEKLSVLKVKSVNFHMQGKSASGGKPAIMGNGKKHHTNKYECTQLKDGQPVLRRGQEFKVTITFDRPYNKAKDDLSVIVEADEESPGKNLSVDFKVDEEAAKPFQGSQHWAARILKMTPEKNSMKLAVYIPGKVAIGEWDFKVRTSNVADPTKLVYEHPKPFVVLFNPWSVDDQVHYTGDKKDLVEYVLNDQGIYYYGSGFSVRRKAWRYEQFKKDILQISLDLLKKAFTYKMTSAMGDPITVSRALSKIVNANDDDGVLQGNWSGEYEGGTSPMDWSSSANILRQFSEEGTVRYGQCWVFSHVLTAVCRALGLPCRSVTNFDSAHDTDGSCTIDSIYDEDGNEISKTDSIWNFHVWNEVWILRPDIEDHDCHGWHTIDATPQESSDGSYQCGPCPVKAVKNGWVNLGFDTPFVFSEVNADSVHWMKRDRDNSYVATKLLTGKIGTKISTKPCDGKPFLELKPKSQDDPAYRLDLTASTRSEEERQAIRRAVGMNSASRKLAERFKNIYDMDVSFLDPVETPIGQDVKMTVVVANRTKQKIDADFLITCRSSNYWNGDDEKVILREKPGTKAIPPKGTIQIPVTVPFSTYFGQLNYHQTIYVYAKATNLANDYPYTAQQPFGMASPDLDIKSPKKAKDGQVVDVKVTITNPLNVPLTNCKLLTDGDMKVHQSDPNKMKRVFSHFSVKFRDIKPKETVPLSFKFFWEAEKVEEDDEEEEGGEEECGAGAEPDTEEPEKSKTQMVELYCKELFSMNASFTVTVTKA
ncbi:hypothetical protein ACOMHN_034246 [Nucella lapillus]